MFKFFKPRLKRETRPDEMFPGATKPTTILAKMIASEILKQDYNPVKVSDYRYSMEVKGFKIDWSYIGSYVTFSSVNIPEYLAETFYRECEKEDKAAEGLYSRTTLINTCKIDEKFRVKLAPYREILKTTKEFPLSVNIKSKQPVFFDGHEKMCIAIALVQAANFAVERKKLNLEAHNQQKAVDLIAQWMDIQDEGKENGTNTVIPC